VDPGEGDVDIDVGLSVKRLSVPEPPDIEITLVSLPDVERNLPRGWSKLAIRFTINDDQSSETADGAIGLVITILAENPAHWQALNVSLLIGQLSVYPVPPDGAEEYNPMVLWSDFTPHPLSAPQPPPSGVLTWETAVAFPDTPIANITTPNDPISVFTVPPPAGQYAWFPTFVYFNVYALAHSPGTVGYVGQPEEATWIGTSGGTSEGRKCAFMVGWKSLREVLKAGKQYKGKGKVRFYVQGVTDRGVVLQWDRCVFVDVDVDWDALGLP